VKKFGPAVALAAALACSVPLVVQSQQPGAPDPSRVVAGTYNVDKDHTQVVWKVNHRGVTPLYGAIGASGGTLVLDPANPSAAKVTVTFSIAEIATTSAGFTKHLMSADFFEVEKNPSASFTSTSVEASGTKSRIAGDLTIKGVTKPIVLEAEFFGAGPNPRSKKLEVGFTATAKFKRSDFGLGFAAPAVSDNVDLEIVVAFLAG